MVLKNMEKVNKQNTASDRKANGKIKFFKYHQKSIGFFYGTLTQQLCDRFCMSKNKSIIIFSVL